jgi:DNA helicase II / ATP-dependent DNA helicase PcrA
MNEAQLQAVRSPHRFIFLFAGAGTGKTTVLLSRIEYLIQQGIDARRILAVTFTRKSAQDMKLRFQQGDVTFQTFHAWCYSVVNTHLTLVGDNIPFSNAELNAFSVYKNHFKKGIPPFKYHRYERFLARHQQLDYDDLLLLTVKQKSVPKYDAVFVDEFQDTNLLQFELLKRLVSKNTYVFAVGDPDQSIYTFRGANQTIIDQYIRHFHAKTYLLHQNYRSDQLIIQLANHVIHHDRSRYPKSLKSVQHQTGSVTVHAFKSVQEEANTVIQSIKKSRYQRKEIAIICRTHQRMYHMIQRCHEKGLINGMYPDIHMLTIHEAKGLEFDVVFFIGLEQNIIPGIRFNHEKLLEERRLLYVAITRARHELHMSYIKSKFKKASQFLHEIKTFQQTK